MMQNADAKLQKPTAEVLNEWQQIEKKTHSLLVTFIKEKNLIPRSFQYYLDQERNINPRGQSLIMKEGGKFFNTPTGKHINEWIELTLRTEKNNKRTVFDNFIAKHNFHYSAFEKLVSLNGNIKHHGIVRLRARPDTTLSLETNNLLVPDTDIAVKMEFPLTREIDDDLPILRAPDDLTRSVLIEEEGDIAAINVTCWGGLQPVFAEMEAKQISEEKRRIIARIREWISNETQHATRFSKWMEARLPSPDDGPKRGMTVYAKRNIKPFKVLGPYSGVLHKTNTSLQQEQRKHGAGRVLSYLWETRSQQRTVSGLRQGNTLSLINTAQLPGVTQAWKQNNVAAVRVGKNLTFYVAQTQIAAGEELLVSYGEDYAPQGETIKLEPESP